MTQPRCIPAILVLALVILALTAGPVAAAPGTGAATPALFASYWDDFVDHWLSALKQQNGVVLAALGVGAVSLFIITRGKWRK